MSTTPSLPTPPPSSTDAATWLQPLRVGDFTLKNRVLFAPCTRNRGNVPTALQVQYYAARASAGLIVTEGTLPTPQGYEYRNAPGIYSAKQVAGWKSVTDAVHSAGGVIFQQVMHIGRVANPLFQAGLPPQGPSAIAAAGGKFRLPEPTPWVDPRGDIVLIDKSYVTPEAIEEPKVVLDEYRTAFRNSLAAGFDGVELHGGNGYLLAQFLDSGSNQRTDAYGGSPENRCRFVLEVMDIAIEIFGAGRVGIKLTPEGGFNDQGMPKDELLATFGHLLRETAARKIAYVEIQRWFSVFDPTKRGTIIPIETWRKLYSGTLFLNGSMAPAEGAELIRAGTADAILFGRAFLANPDLVERLTQGLPLSPFDWSTAFAPGAAGYTDVKTWSELSEEERRDAAKKYEAELAWLAQDKEAQKVLYEKQEAQ